MKNIECNLPDINFNINVDEKNYEMVIKKINESIIPFKKNTEKTIIIEYIVDWESFETSHIPIRNKTITITPEQHDTLYGNADLYINAMYPEITLFEREKLRPKVSLLLYVQNDKLENGKCIYNTEADQWE